MRPAFATNWQKVGFIIVAFLAMAAPLLTGKHLAPPRERIYSAIPWDEGAFPFTHDQIFEESGDIDIAFMGASIMWWGIDTPYVQTELARKIGRPAVVRSLGWDRSGLDAFYFILKDLLAHRRVHLLVFTHVGTSTSEMAHPQANRWFVYGTDAGELAGLGLRSKLSYYNSAIIGMPRNLLDLLRPNLPALPADEILLDGYKPAVNPARRLGSLAHRSSEYFNFTNFTPATSVSPAEVCVSPDTPRSPFEFAGQKQPELQRFFARKIAALAREHNVHLVFLHLPKTTEIGSAVIPEIAFWPEVFQARMELVGIPAAKLYAGMSREDILKLYLDFQHFNENGQKYFTPIITPALLNLYEAKASH